MTTSRRLLPEWAPQEAVILAWPHENTDWAPWLEQARSLYVELIHAINQADCGVLLLIREGDMADFQRRVNSTDKVLLLKADPNDTWLRDYGFLTCQSDQGMQPVEYQFNGWGNKFDASRDNRANREILADLCKLPLISTDIVAEGGALEIDADGHLLSTSLCLLNPERNGQMSLDDYRAQFKQYLGASQVSIFENGHLEGDDTDGHIDTLVRFTPDQGLVIQSCFNRPDDGHFAGLQALVEECRQALPQHQIFELPLPVIFSDEGDRLPASYANYLINNQQVLCPIYGQPEDELALEVLAKAYPAHRIVALDCAVLVQQYGSLHCISMQVPQGTLKDEVIAQLRKGVSVYG
ncbi:agmatine deiminase family protein [Bowmanella yangjiangensis]|uniref:Agmatine deiminase family protein n=1 Tax=Bowmanella yangjiangensis TaxID=2811230 RepID=A0ABS3CUK5_9ALTE|nr:agmatine deiminase family protein [Bowmanella yangjiangensis]MBN7820106.1 agmatine deiminase family protein [Bowmanella yangjiangensis]